MATEVPGLLVTFEANADLSAAQYEPVLLSDDGQVDVTTQGLFSIGVLQNKPSAIGRASTVMCSGITKVRAGAAIDVSVSRVLTAGAGDGVETAASADFVIGYCLATADVVEGDIFSMLLCPSLVPLA
jgi:hypothetical protein